MASKQQRTQKHAVKGQDVECTGQQHTQDQVDTRGTKKTQIDVREELRESGGRQSQGIMDDRTKVQTIIRRVHPKLRSQLNLNEEFLIELKATDPEVISDEEHDEIRTKTGAKRIDHLLDLIKKKTTGAYFTFMEVLERKDGDLYKIVKEVQDTIFTGVFLENPQSNFNLEECQDELKKFYLDEMCKVQLLPWGQGPDDIADMEAIFVDLELVKKETALSLKQSTKLDSNEKLVALKTNRGQRLNRVLVQGEGGSGKSTLLANIAYKWAFQNSQPPALSQYQLVFIIGMHEIQDENAKLIDLIFQQILPEDSKVSKEGLKDYIEKHTKDVLLLVDGLDEDSSSTFLNQSSEVTQILHNRRLRDSCVILTSRPHKVNDLGDFLRNYVPVNLTGFSKENIVRYITKIIQNKAKIQRLLEKLRQEPHLLAMAAIPVLLLMICLLWKDQCSLPDTKTQLYQETINYLWRRYQKKNGLKIMLESQGKNMDPDLATLLYKLGKMALNGIAPLQETEERVVFTEQDIGEDTFMLGCKVGIISRERLRSKLNVVSSVTFLHKTFQEFIAAMYLADLYEVDRPAFDRYLQKLHYLDKEHILHKKRTLHTKPGVLEFCCGIKPEIVPVVMKHNASLVCQCHTYYTYNALPHIHMSLTLRCVLESQLTHNECLNYLQIYSTLSQVSLSISSHEDIASILYQLKLISSQSVSNNHLFFPLLGQLQITIGFTPWLHRLLKYTPNLVTLMINLGTANIHTSDLIPLYEALTGLHHLRYLYMEGHRTRIYSRDISSMLRMMLSHTKENMFATFGMKGFQFDCKLMAEFLISNQSLIHLYLQAPENLNEQTTVTEILSILPNLKKLKRLELRGYKIRSDIMNLKPIISQLEDLYLGVNQLDEKHMIELFSFLNMGHKLRTLYLNGNSITVASMTSLVQCLPGDFYVLGLEETDLNDETACILASRLKVGSTIRILCLYGNPDIGSIGRDALQGLHMKIYWDTRIWVGKSFYSMN